MKRLNFEDGKYTAWIPEDLDIDKVIYIWRYGEPWREFLGDKFISILLDEIAKHRKV